MNAENWHEVKRIFNEVVELPLEKQAEFLSSIDEDDELLKEVEKLLISDREAKTISGGIIPLPKNDFSQLERIGNYKIVREIGEGGMGTVFLASREDFEKQVALKIIKFEFSSKEILRRFQNERKILASLEHQNIARLFDGGTTEKGLPYFVMEYIEGEDLLNYCNSNNLTVDERLRIFRKICSAVSYAHGKLIVHRDLKPSNILVGKDGEPKLLDFGISKLLNEDTNNQTGTATAMGMMTPNYASPEQFRSETVSTSTDIYSLGVILFELLTGSLPYQISNKRIDEVARAVCETNPQKPSDAISEFLTASKNGTNPNHSPEKSPVTNPKLLRGDLDNIILKSLRKEPERRYSSVEKFSDDIRRHIEGLPVTARPDTFSYRAEKFFKRNRLAVLSAAIVLLALLSGVIGITWQYVRAEREKELAQRRFGQVRELANNVLFKYYDEVEKLSGSTKLREMFVSDALTYLDSLAKDVKTDDSLQMEIALAYIRIGKVQGRAYFSNLGDTTGAIENYQKGINLLEPLANKTDETKPKSDLINAYSDLAAALKRQGKIAESDEILRKGLAIAVKFHALKPDDISLSVRLAVNYLYLGDSLPQGRGENENIAAYQNGVNVAEDILRRDPNHVRANNIAAAATDRIATNLLILAKNAEDDENIVLAKQLREKAIPILKNNIVITEKLLSLQPEDTLNKTLVDAARFNESTYLFDSGQFKEALPIQIKAVQEFTKTADEDPENLEQKLLLAAVLQGLGATYSRLGDSAKSEESFNEAFKLFDELVKHDPNNFEYLQKRCEGKFIYGDEILLKGDVEKARQVYEKAYSEIEKTAKEKDAVYSESLRGIYLEKLGNCDLTTSKQSNLLLANRRESLKRAIDFYQQTIDIWKQSGVQNILGITQTGKLEILQRKLNKNQELLSKMN